MAPQSSATGSVQRDSRLEGRIACITGAGSGLGRATALRFAASGARVACADLKPGAEAVDAEIRTKFGDDRAIFIQVDVQDESQIEGMIKQTVDWAGRLDIMCNFAGIALEAVEGTSRRIHETSSSHFDKTMGINARGVWLCCKYAVTQMLAQDPLPPNARGDQTRGWIINAASILGLVAGPGSSSYVPSKFAVVGMTKQIAIDYAKDRIHCNALCPGFVVSPMIASMIENKEVHDFIADAHPWNALGQPNDIASAALFLASDDA